MRPYRHAFVIRQSLARLTALPSAPGSDLLFPKVQTGGETAFFFLIKRNKPAVSSITWSMQGCCKFKDLNSLQSGPGPHQLISLIYGF